MHGTKLLYTNHTVAQFTLYHDLWSGHPRMPVFTYFENKLVWYYNMTVWILAGNYISFTIAAGLIRLHMPGVKKSRV